MRQRAKRDYRTDALTAEKRKSRCDKLKDLTCALNLEKWLFLCVFVCAHQKSAACKIQTDSESQRKLEIELVMFLSRLLEYVVL